MSGTYQFGEASGPTLTMVELAGSGTSGSAGSAGTAGSTGTSGTSGASGGLQYQSGFVNAGTFITLDNIKATVTTSGNRGLSVAMASGSATGYISGQYQVISGGSNGGASTTSLSTTATSSMFGWNFMGQGDTATFILRDDTNSKVYRIIMIIGYLYNNNFISIERLA
jgi:hypothetical protein